MTLCAGEQAQMKPLENHMVIGDYYPRRQPAEPDPDANPFEMWRTGEFTAEHIKTRLTALSARCPHNCKGCTCRTDPRQMVLPFDEVS